ncbi:MAG: hypothetical protein KAT79_05440 [candidate division Zixibacteria bacterium]|nr:hypothetical protein [candidate division Zixibacteria bacterium]
MLRIFLSVLLSSSLLLSCSSDQGQRLTGSDSNNSNLPMRVSPERDIYATVCGCPTDVNMYETYIVTACIWEGSPLGGPVIPGASISIAFLYDNMECRHQTPHKITNANGNASWSVWFTFGPGHYTAMAFGTTAEGERFYDYDRKWLYISQAPLPPGWLQNEAAKRYFTGKYFKEGLREIQR